MILTMGSSGGAAVGVVAKGMNVHATLGIRVVAGDVPADGGGSILRLLLEGDSTRDLGVSTDDGNWKQPEKLAGSLTPSDINSSLQPTAVAV